LIKHCEIHEWLNRRTHKQRGVFAGVKPMVNIIQEKRFTQCLIHSFILSFICENIHLFFDLKKKPKDEMDLAFFTSMKEGSTARTIRWMMNRGLLANPLHCGACNEGMALVAREGNHIDGVQW